ncbi:MULTISPECIES: hypothetical protein [unclassified Kutzneria]|uniref:hypothetical protein n=1 Tax=unclassified Kutzneria TaxID=2621979 RepID=UPI0003EEB4FC|nr:hypothetical protein [Kutzneria sp. 744]EWM12726.1 hypothetical protein KUTG_03030 [Kutzneria sp. 744]
MSQDRIAEELRLLIDALAEKAEPWLQRFAAEGAEHEPSTCDWCPVCAVAAVVRGERSELAARAAEHAVGLLTVLRMALQQERTAPAHDAEQPAPPRVQKITVRRRGQDPC